MLQTFTQPHYIYFKVIMRSFLTRSGFEVYFVYSQYLCQHSEIESSQLLQDLTKFMFQIENSKPKVKIAKRFLEFSNNFSKHNLSYYSLLTIFSSELTLPLKLVNGYQSFPTCM